MSVIIPAHNEATSIGRCIDSVSTALSGSVRFEVVVVDNKSLDETPEIAKRHGARVITSAAATISAVRNAGVANSVGEILLFLDADCFLGQDWQDAFTAQIEILNSEEKILLGSHPLPPVASSPFLWRYWFTPYIQLQSESHLGSAHLMCSRRTFIELGGFDEDLRTGEDYDLCRRLMEMGGQVVVDAKLVAFHDGYPTDLAAFFRRELWHGLGDMQRIGTFLRSRIAVAGALFTASLLCAGLSLPSGMYWLTATFSLFSIGILTVSAVVRFRGYPLRTAMIASVCILPFYLLARGLAFTARFRRWG